MSKQQELIEFSQRLNEACDDKARTNKDYLDHGRQTALGKALGVSQESARKWVREVAFPSVGHMIMLAKELGVAFEWLATGRGPKHLGPTVPPGSPTRIGLKVSKLNESGQQWVEERIDEMLRPLPKVSGEN